MKLKKWILSSSTLLLGSSLLTMSCSTNVAKQVEEYKNELFFHNNIEDYYEDEDYMKEAFKLSENITGVKYQDDVEESNLVEKINSYNERLKNYNLHSSIEQEYEEENGYIYNEIDETYYPVNENYEEQMDSTIDVIYSAGQMFNENIKGYEEEVDEISNIETSLDELGFDVDLLSGQYTKDQIKQEFFTDTSTNLESTVGLSALLVKAGISTLSKNVLLAAANFSLKTITAWWITLNLKIKLILVALAVIVVVIVSNWFKIRHEFPNIVNWFMSSLWKIGSSIASFFTKTGSQAKESLYTYTIPVSSDVTLQATKIENVTPEKGVLYAAAPFASTLLISKVDIYHKKDQRLALMKSHKGTYTFESGFALTTLRETIKPVATRSEIDRENGVPKFGYYHHYHGYSNYLTTNEVHNNSIKMKGHSWYGNPYGKH